MSNKQELLQEIAKLLTSNPVFKIGLESNGWRGEQLTLSCINKVQTDPTTVAWTNPLASLAKLHFLESFDTSSRRYVADHETMMHRINSELKHYFLNFLSINVGRDTDIYKWYDSYALHERNYDRFYMEPILSLFKYIKNHEVDSDWVSKHMPNALGILEFLYQRDFKEDHLPQRRVRRRRKRK